MQRWALSGAHRGPDVGLGVGLGPKSWAMGPRRVGLWAQGLGPLVGPEDVYC
jgi:hypothetical protein